MFDSRGYTTTKMRCIPMNNGGYIRQSLYKFSVPPRMFKDNPIEKRVYHVIVDEFSGNLFLLKFFLAKDAQKEERFNIIIGDFNAPRILKTIINIMVQILNKNTHASFAFVGSPKINKKNGGVLETENPQRYRIYKMLAMSLFGIERVHHAGNDRVGAYMLINKINTNPAEFTQKNIDMFSSLYPDTIRMYGIQNETLVTEEK